MRECSACQLHFYHVNENLQGTSERVGEWCWDQTWNFPWCLLQAVPDCLPPALISGIWTTYSQMALDAKLKIPGCPGSQKGPLWPIMAIFFRHWFQKSSFRLLRGWGWRTSIWYRQTICIWLYMLTSHLYVWGLFLIRLNFIQKGKKQPLIKDTKKETL